MLISSFSLLDIGLSNCMSLKSILNFTHSVIISCVSYRTLPKRLDRFLSSLCNYCTGLRICHRLFKLLCDKDGLDGWIFKIWRQKVVTKSIVSKNDEVRGYCPFSTTLSFKTRCPCSLKLGHTTIIIFTKYLNLKIK